MRYTNIETRPPLKDNRESQAKSNAAQPQDKHDFSFQLDLLLLKLRQESRATLDAAAATATHAAATTAMLVCSWGRDSSVMREPCDARS